MAHKLIDYLNQYFGDLVDPRKVMPALVREFKPDEDILWDRETKLDVKVQKMSETYVNVVGNQRDVDDWDEWEFTIEFPEKVTYTFTTTIPAKKVYEGLYGVYRKYADDQRALKSTVTRFMADKKAMTALAEIPALVIEGILEDPKTFEYLYDDIDEFVTLEGGGTVNANDENFTVERKTVTVDGVGGRQTLVVHAVLQMTLDLELDQDDIEPDEPDYEPDPMDIRKRMIEEPEYYGGGRWASSKRSVLSPVAIVDQYFGGLIKDARSGVNAIIKSFNEGDFLYETWYPATTTIEPLKMEEQVIGSEDPHTLEFPGFIKVTHKGTYPAEDTAEDLFWVLSRLAKDRKALQAAAVQFVKDKDAMRWLADVLRDALTKEVQEPKILLEMMYEEFDQIEDEINAVVTPSGTSSFFIYKTVPKVTVKGDTRGLHIDASVVVEWEFDENRTEVQVYDEVGFGLHTIYASNNLRRATLRIASNLPKGDATRRKLLAVLQEDEG